VESGIRVVTRRGGIGGKRLGRYGNRGKTHHPSGALTRTGSLTVDGGMRRITFWRPVGLSPVSLSVEVLLYSIPLPATVTVKRDGVAKRKNSPIQL
jgi:hypothetical protein